MPFSFKDQEKYQERYQKNASARLKDAGNVSDPSYFDTTGLDEIGTEKAADVDVSADGSGLYEVKTGTEKLLDDGNGVITEENRDGDDLVSDVPSERKTKGGKKLKKEYQEAGQSDTSPDAMDTTGLDRIDSGRSGTVPVDKETERASGSQKVSAYERLTGRRLSDGTPIKKWTEGGVSSSDKAVDKNVNDKTGDKKKSKKRTLFGGRSGTKKKKTDDNGSGSEDGLKKDTKVGKDTTGASALSKIRGVGGTYTESARAFSSVKGNAAFAAANGGAATISSAGSGIMNIAGGVGSAGKAVGSVASSILSVIMIPVVAISTVFVGAGITSMWRDDETKTTVSLTAYTATTDLSGITKASCPNAYEFYQDLVSIGFSSVTASAILGNAFAESGGDGTSDLNPASYDVESADGHGSYGLIQFPARDSGGFFEWCANNSREQNDIMAQAEFMKMQLDTGHWWYVDPAKNSEKALLDAGYMKERVETVSEFYTLTDLSDAVCAYLAYYEECLRAGTVNGHPVTLEEMTEYEYTTRMNCAIRVFQEFAGNTYTSTAGTGVSSTGEVVWADLNGNDYSMYGVTASAIISKAEEIANYVYENGWHYTKEKCPHPENTTTIHGNPALPEYQAEKVIVCDRFVDWVLYDLGMTDMPSEGACVGLGANTPLWTYLEEHGFEKITSVQDLQPGDIVISNSYQHTFIVGECVDRANAIWVRYDCGSCERIRREGGSSNISTEAITNFSVAYRAPSGAFSSAGTDSTESSTP